MNKEQILDAVTEIAQEKGWERTSVREISRHIGYSTIKIYSEFGSKENLLQAIQRKGFSLLNNAYTKAIESEDHPKGQLKALCLAHFHFAFQHKFYYDLMFQMSGVNCGAACENTLLQASAPVRELLEEIHGSMNRDIFTHWWALMHGYVAISLNNQCLNKEEGEAILEKIVDRFSGSL